MKLHVSKLTDFSSNHCFEAEKYIQEWICNQYNFIAGNITEGFNPDYDFSIANTKVELKVSTKGTTTSSIELSRDNGDPAGLSATKSDVYLFLNQAGPDIGKLRVIKTKDLLAYYLFNTGNRKIIKGYNDKIGSCTAILNFKNFNDLMIGECEYSNGVFDLDTLQTNNYATRFITKYIN